MLDCFFVVRTAAFESRTPKSNFINERCFGEDFAAWLREGLVEVFDSVSAPIQEDWGWGLQVRRLKATHFVSVGIMDESIGSSPAEWRVGVTRERRFFLLRPDTRTYVEVCTIIDGILATDPRFDVVDRQMPT